MTANLLSRETSPYLLQHKDNPVHWRPWGDAALAEAKEAGKPILLSVGYAACHWCHVMAHESFEDADTAALMNDLFVNIKVDREERPDIDTLYMSALHLLGEQGGWPLTMFLTPDAEPFWGGTYFPPTPRFGRPSFRAVLREVARLHKEDRTMIDNNRQALRLRLETMAQATRGNSLAPDDVDEAARRLRDMLDPVHGGIAGAPKFPNTAVFETVLRAGLRNRARDFIDPVILTLDRIAQGGIYDHLGGGFARYSVDNRWLAPHFEKMLYDNAQLIALMTTAWQVSGTDLLCRRVEDTVSWLDREMLVENAAFASSLDADSEGEEGKFYVWTRAEIIDALGSAAGSDFSDAYDVTETGNWEGKTILNRLHVPPGTEDGAEARFVEARRTLLAERDKRIRPGLDDKVLADWNGLMISALARAGAVFGRNDWIDRARTAFDFIVKRMGNGDRLIHSWRAGSGTVDGLASDYANMAAAAITLAETTGESDYVDRANGWLCRLQDHFASETGGFHMSAADATDLIVRPLAGTDDATPSASAVAADAMIRLECFTGNTSFRDPVEGVLSSLGDAARSHPFAHATLLAAAERAHNPTSVVITGGADAGADALVEAYWSVTAPNAVLLRAGSGTDLPTGHPAHGKPTDEVAAFVCEGQTCSLPITEPPALRDRLTNPSTPA